MQGKMVVNAYCPCT